MDYNLSVHGVLQARIQEWAAISLSKLINLSLPQFLKLENEQSTRMVSRSCGENYTTYLHTKRLACTLCDTYKHSIHFNFALYYS